jgi:hypothetical protein
VVIVPAEGVDIAIPPHGLKHWKSLHDSTSSGYCDEGGHNIMRLCILGTVIRSALNHPGSWHGASVSRELPARLSDEIKTPLDYYIIADSAFPHSGAMQGKIRVPLSTQQKLTATPTAISFSTALTGVRQSAEFGMNGIKSKFPRLAVPLGINAEYRLQVRQVITRLYKLKI